MTASHSIKIDPITKTPTVSRGHAAPAPPDSPGSSEITCLTRWLPAGLERRLYNGALFAMPIILILILWLTNPFRDELVRRVFSMVPLNPNQRYNIQLASRAINNYVIKPGQEFSFNGIVGPRENRRGYRAARSYLGTESPTTMGGGICLLSSALYQAALATGLKIDERTPHMRTIASVPPGLDATVWYGRADLKFKNTTSSPLQIKTECRNNNLYVSICGTKDDSIKSAQLEAVPISQNHDEVLVEVFRNINGKRTFVSRDSYQISR